MRIFDVLEHLRGKDHIECGVRSAQLLGRADVLNLLAGSDVGPHVLARDRREY